MTQLTMVEAIRETLRAEMHRDERVILMGEDVGHLGGVFRATEGLRQQFGAQRVVDTPLAESVIAGSAVGLAISGLIPVIEMQFLGFSQNAFHQICQQIARTRFRTRRLIACCAAEQLLRQFRLHLFLEPLFFRLQTLLGLLLDRIGKL